ncbi:hypothetical protein WA158_006454 [Blastocystis sp. Blastoise]
MSSNQSTETVTENPIVEETKNEVKEATSPTSPSTSKPFNSTYYKWSQGIEESRKVIEQLGVNIAPKKIESPAVVEQPSTCGSVWNKGGTWEETDKTKWSKTRITELLKDGLWIENDYTITIPEVEKCDGQATVVFVKGKKRPGYDFSIKCKWEAIKEGSTDTAKGVFVIDEFADYCDGDYEVAIRSNKSDSYHTSAKAAVTKAKKDIISTLLKWKDEFYAL